MKYTTTFKKAELRKVLPDLYLTFNGFDFGLIDTLKIRDVIFKDEKQGRVCESLSVNSQKVCIVENKHRSPLMAMENKITNDELLISRYKFLKKNWWKFFGGGIIWILILILRDLFLEKKALWVACLFFYGINFIRWCMHYLLSRNYSKDEYPQVIHVYLWKYPIIKCIMILISVCVGCFYLFTGRCIGIVIYTILLCSGLDELFEYLELKRVFKDMPIE